MTVLAGGDVVLAPHRAEVERDAEEVADVDC
jgi:hypothetical protein